MSELKERAKRLAALVALALVVSAVHALGGFELVERPLQSLRFRIAQRRVGPDVILVAIDSASFRTAGEWPFPRKSYAVAVESLAHAGAKRIALAVDLASGAEKSDERVLEKTLQSIGGGVVVPAVHVAADGGAPGTERLPPESLRAMTVMASADLPRDGDGLVRRYTVENAFEGKAVPSLAMSMNGRWTRPHDTFSIDFGIDPDSIPRLSFADVLSGRYDPAVVAGKTVLVGVTAPELAGAVTVPTGRALPPIVVHALALESMVLGRTLHRTGFVVCFLGVLSLAFCLNRWRSLVLAHGRAHIIAGGLIGGVAISLGVQWALPFVLDVSPWMVVLVAMVAFAEAPRAQIDAPAASSDQARTERAEQMVRYVVDNSFDAVIQVSKEGVVEIFNEAAQRMFGYRSLDAVGRSINELVRPLDGSLSSKASADAFHPGPTIREATGVRRDGSRFPVELRVAEIDSARSRRRLGTLRDITSRKAHERALEHQARHDALTGLPNRVMLRERVVRALNQAEREDSQVGFFILDLDRFKEVNDTLGHHVGDMVLQEIGERLRSALRESDTIARMGGDEFAVLLPGTDGETARDVARRLVESLAHPLELQGLSLQIEASIGIAMFPQDGRDASDVIQRADVAMYMAKRQRTGFAVYEAGSDLNSVRHLTLNGELRRAIDENDLVLYYQPKISAESGRIIGAEALVRWNHAAFGMIPPDDFIALAEHSGLIKPLTRWVLNEAMRQAADWQWRGFPVTMAVNVSARNLLEPGMPESIAQLLQDNGLASEMLVCEITESVIMEDPRRSLEAIMKLVGLGVTIAVDDFGTGYSSLAYLRQLPAAEIKIDKTFVMKMDREKDDALIVGSTIQMAHSLGLKVVAEGVENDRIWGALMALGCDYGQGYYFSRPVPPKAFFELLQTAAEVSPYAPLTDLPERLPAKAEGGES